VSGDPGGSKASERSPAASSGGELAVVLTLAAVSALGTMAIHMLVPALPALAHELAIGEASAQQLVSVYLIGLAGGQLVAGPLADRFGRRPIMLAGMTLYVAGAVVAVFATGLWLLLAARLVQALGGAAGLVTSRVMVGDLYGEREAAKRQATLMGIVTVSPAIAPVIGGLLTDLLGWRAIPALLGLIGAAALAAAHALLPETRVSAVAATNAPVGLAAGYRRLAGNLDFVLTTVALATSAASLYMYLAAAPFVLVKQAGMSPTATGTSLLLVAGSIIVGTRLVARAQKQGDALLIGSVTAAIGAGAAMVLAASGIVGPVALLAPVVLVAIGAGIVGPAGINDVAFAEEGLAATATSLAGALQMAASSLATVLLGLFTPLDTPRLALALTISTGLGLACALLRGWRSRRHRA
jgi:DHA1 family bicyclomycin/chloramphenicol resistance-like MFS transporter